MGQDRKGVWQQVLYVGGQCGDSLSLSLSLDLSLFLSPSSCPSPLPLLPSISSPSSPPPPHPSLCYSKTGILVFGEKGVPGGTEAVSSALSINNIPYEELSGAEANRRYPQQLQFPENYTCVYEMSGGLLKANKAVATLQVYSIP